MRMQQKPIVVSGFRLTLPIPQRRKPLTAVFPAGPRRAALRCVRRSLNEPERRAQQRFNRGPLNLVSKADDCRNQTQGLPK